MIKISIVFLEHILYILGRSGVKQFVNLLTLKSTSFMTDHSRYKYNYKMKAEVACVP